MSSFEYSITKFSFWFLKYLNNDLSLFTSLPYSHGFNSIILLIFNLSTEITESASPSKNVIAETAGHISII
jgi:hypothetical protein